MFRKTLAVQAPRRGLHDVTAEVAEAVRESGVEEGMCNVFLQHTSASLVLNENWDPSVRVDLERYLDRLVPEGEPRYTHTLEGPDDMPSHIKAALTPVSLTIPVAGGRLALGNWQGVYLWEHRDNPGSRNLVVTVF
jgi:secondary thiamine-phosphate synthase enzyme